MYLNGLLYLLIHLAIIFSYIYIFFFAECHVYICDFHREQAWERWLNKKENGLSDKKNHVLCILRRIAREETTDRYKKAVEDLKSSDSYSKYKIFKLV